MLQSIFYIFLFALLGELIHVITRIPVPGPVIGMALMFAALQWRLIGLGRVKPAADVLTRNLALFFVPPGVGLMVYGDLLREQGLVIILAALLSTLAVLIVTGWLYQLIARRHE